jgi:hypothetical protein
MQFPAISAVTRAHWWRNGGGDFSATVRFRPRWLGGPPADIQTSLQQLQAGLDYFEYLRNHSPGLSNFL